MLVLAITPIVVFYLTSHRHISRVVAGAVKDDARQVYE
jgi:hypothetical protein